MRFGVYGFLGGRDIPGPRLLRQTLSKLLGSDGRWARRPGNRWNPSGSGHGSWGVSCGTGGKKKPEGKNPGRGAFCFFFFFFVLGGGSCSPELLRKWNDAGHSNDHSLDYSSLSTLQLGIYGQCRVKAQMSWFESFAGDRFGTNKSANHTSGETGRPSGGRSVLTMPTSMGAMWCKGII